MTLQPPLSEMDILRGVHRAPEFQLPENATQVRVKPRASGLMSDARTIAYQMAGVPESDPYVDWDDRVDGRFTQEQGRLAENISIPAINATGTVRVVNSQISLPDDYFVTGHPDGELEFYRAIAGSGMQMSAGFFPKDHEGLKWGFEHKHFGRFGYLDIAKDGPSPEIMAQTVLYGDALGWDACMVVVTSQDASSIRWEFRSHVHKEHPKMMVFAVDIREYQDEIAMLKRRAEWFTEWAKNSGDPLDVAIEARRPSKTAFPWSYSEYVTRMLEDGQSGERAPSPPFVRDWA